MNCKQKVKWVIHWHLSRIMDYLYNDLQLHEQEDKEVRIRIRKVIDGRKVAREN